MARLTVLSGMGRKSAAAFLLQTEGRRLLLDMGGGLEVGEHLDLSRAGRVDAVLLSHAHVDHVGALDRLAEIGSPPVFATAETLRQLPAGLRPAWVEPLPERGTADVLGLRLDTGRSGHAPGGIWMRVPTLRGGFLYTGDFSTEAALLRCDPFPRSATVLADASYGDREESLAAQIETLAEAARGGAVLPCPADGRGPDMVAALTAAGLEVQACAQIAAETERLTGSRPPVATAETAQEGHIIVADGPNAEHGLPGDLRMQPGFRFVFSGHIPRSSPAHAMIAEGRARWMGWNVHPRLCDLIELAAKTRAERVLPAFIDLATAPRLTAALGPRLRHCTSLEV
ncbi:MBL fold metallo-hydrolase [Salipiger sp. PrR002]|uniref:MBL fold metallo-hydrolase n=1 Tax=Salipiger sp. PrR002 TaxID=2706489 RepID=UPI0013BD9FB1|nr:MBL fold metallo-hydrolase [Salipiger sp. PrR002]NDW00473.1 MBL fold metallo-hydrolase [Salipiger sp. PrR002]NDW56431.1 MBL fold metallo-hydrolase [Salipiger sp. PrR004]